MWWRTNKSLQSWIAQEKLKNKKWQWPNDNMLSFNLSRAWISEILNTIFCKQSTEVVWWANIRTDANCKHKKLLFYCDKQTFSKWEHDHVHRTQRRSVQSGTWWREVQFHDKTRHVKQQRHLVQNSCLSKFPGEADCYITPYYNKATLVQFDVHICWLHYSP